MFRGNQQTKVDEKGRLKIPSAFKTLLDAANVTQFYITSTDGKSAQIWPLPEWETQEKLLAEAEMDDGLQKYLRLTSYYGHQVEIDNQGRVLLPQVLREKAKLNAEVSVLGQLFYLEVQNERELEQLVNGNEMTAEERRSVAAKARRNR